MIDQIIETTPNKQTNKQTGPYGFQLVRLDDKSRIISPVSGFLINFVETEFLENKLKTYKTKIKSGVSNLVLLTKRFVEMGGMLRLDRGILGEEFDVGVKVRVAVASATNKNPPPSELEDSKMGGEEMRDERKQIYSYKNEMGRGKKERWFLEVGKEKVDFLLVKEKAMMSRREIVCYIIFV